MNWFCWTISCFTVFESETLMSQYRMKWMVESKGGVLSNIDTRIKSTLSRTLWSGWDLTSYVMVVTRWGKLSKPTFCCWYIESWKSYLVVDIFFGYLRLTIGAAFLRGSICCNHVIFGNCGEDGDYFFG